MLGLVFLAAGAGIAWAAGDWSAAQSKAEEFKGKQEELKSLTPDEARSIVKAICEADEDERKDVGHDISERVKGVVSDKYEELKSVKEEAERKLDEVIDDDDLKDNHEDAKSLKEDVARRWEIVDRMTRSLRGANHPVVAFMIKQGQQAHKDRQEHCDAREVVLESGRADCLMATGSTCKVIELKPKNSKAIGKGKEQAQNYARDLNEELKNRGESKVIKKLIETKSEFGNCERFEQQVDCYTLCPEIDDNDEFREVRADWDTDC